MPRTTAVESPGCPPLRALTTDILGLVKVVEARAKPAGAAKVVETWGAPDASRAIVAASLADRTADPVLAVARKNGVVELLNPLIGDSLAAVKTVGSEANDSDPLVALHLFTRQPSDSMLGSFIACTEKGKAYMRSVPKEDDSSDADAGPSSTWDVCSGDTVQFCSVDHGESYAMFVGKGIEMNLWDITTCSKIWSAKSPRANSLGIFTRPWFTAGTFLCKDDHRKIVACTNDHQVRLYDTALQRRPAISVDFRNSPIKAVAADPNGHAVYIGTGTGDLASYDMRTGKLLGCYVGKCSGSIRSIVRHPELPLIASCAICVSGTQTRDSCSLRSFSSSTLLLWLLIHISQLKVCILNSCQPHILSNIGSVWFRSEVERSGSIPDSGTEPLHSIFGKLERSGSVFCLVCTVVAPELRLHRIHCLKETFQFLGTSSHIHVIPACSCKRHTLNRLRCL